MQSRSCRRILWTIGRNIKRLGLTTTNDRETWDPPINDLHLLALFRYLSQLTFGSRWIQGSSSSTTYTRRLRIQDHALTTSFRDGGWVHILYCSCVLHRIPVCRSRVDFQAAFAIGDGVCKRRYCMLPSHSHQLPVEPPRSLSFRDTHWARIACGSFVHDILQR